MPIFTIRTIWEEDDNTYRDVVIETGHTFYQIHEVLMKALGFKIALPSSFYLSDDHWRLGRRISSEVEKNIKGAEALSMKRTPFSALVEKPAQRFVYIYDEDGKAWTFHIHLIAIKPSGDEKLELPKVTKSIGVEPAKTRVGKAPSEQLSDIEDKYDLDQSNLDQEGFSTE